MQQVQLLPVLLQEQQPVQEQQQVQVQPLAQKKELYLPQRKQTSQLKNLTCVNREKNL